MVKILEMGVQAPDAEEEDDCCEIDPAEFAKKVNLKSDDDEVVIVAAKGQIKVKVELDQSGHAAETPVRNLRECAAGDSLEKPYEIQDDESSVRQMQSVEAKPDAVCIPDNSKIDALGDVKCATDKSKIDVLADAKSIPDEITVDAAADVKCIPHENKINVLAGVKCIPDENKIDPLGDVKCATDKSKIDVLADAKSIPDEIKIDAAADVKCIPDEKKTDVLADVKCCSDMTSLKFGNFEVFIQDMLHVKCEHEESNGIDEGVEEEDAYDHLPEMDGVNLEEYLGPGGGVFEEEDSDDFVVVGREAL